MDVAAAKQRLRDEVRAAMRALPPARRALEEETVQAAVQANPEWRAARTVLLYAAKPPEFSVVGLTLAAWREGKETLFPRVAGPGTIEVCHVGSWADLQVGAYGIREPARALPAMDVLPDVAIIPAVAFDAAGRRLGQGGGYYDRWLDARRQAGRAGRGRMAAWGVGFDCQLVRGIPWEPHDATLDKVWTCAVAGLLDGAQRD